MFRQTLLALSLLLDTKDLELPNAISFLYEPGLSVVLSSEEDAVGAHEELVTSKRLL